MVLAANGRPGRGERKEQSPLAPMDQVRRNGVVEAACARVFRNEVADGDVDPIVRSIDHGSDNSLEAFEGRAGLRLTHVVLIGIDVRRKSFAVVETPRWARQIVRAKQTGSGLLRTSGPARISAK